MARFPRTGLENGAVHLNKAFFIGISKPIPNLQAHFASAQTPKSLKFLDGLRGFAALYVVFFHISAEFWGYQAKHIGPSRLMLVWQKLFGFAGHACVTLFICLSGFSLFLPLAKRQNQGLQTATELRNYAIRRALRIIPPYYATILIVLALAVMIPGINTLTSTIWNNAIPIFDTKSIVFHVLLIHGFDRTTLYQLSPQLWSIGTEAQIYLWLPFVIVPLARRRSIELAVSVSLAFSMAVLFVPALDGVCLHYVFSFTLGAYAAHLAFQKAPLRDSVQNLTSLLILLQVVLVATFAELQGSDFGLQDILLTVPFAILLYALAKSHSKTFLARFPNRLLGSRLCQFLGRISYSLYLIHYVIIAAVHSVCVQSGLSVSSTVLSLMIIAPLLAILAATLMRRLIEEPFLKISAKFRESPSQPPNPPNLPILSPGSAL